MNIALDYDHTYTADKFMWDLIIPVMQARGHTVKIVTMRCHKLDHHDDFPLLWRAFGVDTIFCDGEAKKKITDEQGFLVDIWIDDSPEGINLGSSFTPEQLAEWRTSQRKIIEDAA